MIMNKSWLLLVIIMVIIAGCGSESPLSTEDTKPDREITPADVLLVIDEGGVPLEDTHWIVCNIGAQLLESKLKQYESSGLDETDFSRMPENELTENIRQLYLDMKPLVE